MTAKLIFLVHTASTLILVGLIWTVQVVQYPLFSRVGMDAFPHFHTAHSRQITWVVAPLMIAELVTGLCLLVERPAQMAVVWVWLGLLLIAAIWLSTAFLQIPMHQVLGEGFDPEAHRFLVRSNWLRTIAWTLRALLVLWLAARLIGPPSKSVLS